jgi:hypothetical protein
MKKISNISLILLIGSLIIGCSKNQPKPPEPPEPETVFTEVPADQLLQTIQENSEKTGQGYIVEDYFANTFDLDHVPENVGLKISGLDFSTERLNRADYTYWGERIDPTKLYKFYITYKPDPEGQIIHFYADKIEGLISIEEWFQIDDLRVRTLYTLTENDVEVEQNKDGTLTIKNCHYRGLSRNFIFPEKLHGMEVTAISTGGIFSGKGLIGIQLPSTIEHIGSFEFSNNKLTEIVLPESIGIIGIETFANNRISKITIPENVKFIYMDYAAFSSNPITSIAIPDGVKGNTLVETGFNNFYESQNRRGGTYVKNGQIWTRQE